ncbi:MAG: nucleotidyltransferase domain-containing protein [Bacteroidia bacterium]|nr:nucleotidyltransferase domain-containing protein [Bacteroidia bacterium]
MVYNTQNDKILSNIINQIVEVADPDKIILFGSRASGKQEKKSDYDVCVLKNNIKNLDKFTKKIYLNLYGIGAAVDVIVQSMKNFEELKDKWFFIYYDIAKNGKVVYEK